MTDAPTPIQQKLDQFYKRSDTVQQHQNTTEIQHYEALVVAAKSISTQDANGKWSYDFKLLKNPSTNEKFQNALVAFYEEKIRERFGDAINDDELSKYQLFEMVAGFSATQIKNFVRTHKEGYIGFHPQIVGDHVRRIKDAFTPYIREDIKPADIEGIFTEIGVRDKVDVAKATLEDAVTAALRKREEGTVSLGWLRDKELLSPEYMNQFSN